jgi:hypothetical protein
MKNQFWNNIIHILAGITLGYLMFGCKTSKSNCDAYSNNKIKQHENISRR